MSRTENEPPVPRCLGSGSLVFAPTAGMRLAPEVLVQELFRELSQGDSRNLPNTGAQEFADVLPELGEGERLLLSTCRGRRREGRGTKKGRDFYAPPYPDLARHAWFRKKTDRTVRDYFLGGPLAHCSSLHDELLVNVVGAVLGGRTATSTEDVEGREILSLIGQGDRQRIDHATISDHLRLALQRRASAPLPNTEDALAIIITEDFVELCRLEIELPRREWLFFLIAFLRTAIGMWMLAHLQITIRVRDRIYAAAEGRGLSAAEDFTAVLGRRYEGLLHPSSSPTRELVDHVEEYMRARVELRLLVGAVEDACPGEFLGAGGKKTLTLSREGASCIPLSRLLVLVQRHHWRAGMADGLSLRQWLTREAEKWPAWRSPLTKGQGKNIDEFLRVLRRSPTDDSGSGLLIRHQLGTAIVPGHRLLQLFAFLAGRRKVRQARAGRLVLRDLEDHLYRYGLDFRSSSFGRPLLLEKLSEGGFLVGSPDAAESAVVLNTLGGAQR